MQFKLSVKSKDNGAVIRHLHLKVCKSSWYNNWCKKKDTKFGFKECSYDRNLIGQNGYLAVCTLDKSAMCALSPQGGDWLHGIYLVTVVGVVDGNETTSKSVALSPWQSSINCPEFEIFGTQKHMNC